jgi:hypothetical protein
MRIRESKSNNPGSGGLPLEYQLLGRLRLGEGLQFQTNAGKKIYETPISKEKSWVCWHAPFTPVMVGSLKEGDCGPGQAGQK